MVPVQRYDLALVRRVAAALTADAAPRQLGEEFGVYPLGSGTWVFPGAGPDREEPEDFGDTGLVASFRKSFRLVSSDEDGFAAEVVIETIAFIQDEIMDDLGRGWPEYRPSGSFEGILLPTESEQEFWWGLRGEPLVAIGQLHTLEGVTSADGDAEL